jgi:nitroreductase/Pyruvate/2-oxoacid:ferredoxin oxidoreductase delta subunit
VSFLPVTTEIDSDLCNGCGLCVEACPSMTLSMVDGRAAVTGEESIHCGHCAAICPEGAITVSGIDPDALVLSTVENRDEWLDYGRFDAAALVQLMRSRRSCRMFAEDPVPREVLEDLVRIGITAPSGTNSQAWTFTLLPDRAAVMHLGAEIGGFFRKLNKMAANPAIRILARLLRKRELGDYYREYYQTVQEALREHDETGRDRLFHGAPAVIVIGMRPGASCPCEDAHMASQNILLAAHAMGYGTCMIGFAVEAMKNSPGIKTKIGIPRNEPVYAVIAAGKPREPFHRPAGRKKLVPRYFRI